MTQIGLRILPYRQNKRGVFLIKFSYELVVDAACQKRSAFFGRQRGKSEQFIIGERSLVTDCTVEHIKQNQYI
jgi:hypothetical protein